MRLRVYTPGDRDGCLAIFDSNTPDFFAIQERHEFEAFLDDPALMETYFVVEDTSAGIVGCGGYFILPGAPIAILTWGMVVRALHRKRVGSFLLLSRLTQIYEEGISTIGIKTSQYSSPFFERHGFVTEHITEHGFAPDLHQYDMMLQLDQARCEEMKRQLASF